MTQIGPGYQTKPIYPLIHPIISTNICEGLRKMRKMHKPQFPVEPRVLIKTKKVNEFYLVCNKI